MNIKKLSNAEMSSALFEIGFALKLRKVTTEEIEKCFTTSKINKLISKIENKDDLCNWDGSHITSGELLRAALRAHEITQAELARKIGVSSQKINDLIKNRLPLSLLWAKKIGKALKVNYKTFL